MEQVVRAAIGLGSNMGDRHALMAEAVQRLRETPGIQVLRVSTFLETKPIGPVTDQPDFLNAVVSLETRLSPWDLLDQMQSIETVLGRKRTLRWGPRTIDLDLLLYGDRTLNDARLTVPHPELEHRDFWLEGLKELAITLPAAHATL